MTPHGPELTPHGPERRKPGVEPGQRGSELTPIRQRWLPQTSLRFFILLIALCAVAMYTFRAAVVDDLQWAKIASLLMATAVGCFLAYSGLFVVAYLFSMTVNVTWSSVARRRQPASDDSSHRNTGDH